MSIQDNTATMQDGQLCPMQKDAGFPWQFHFKDHIDPLNERTDVIAVLMMFGETWRCSPCLSVCLSPKPLSVRVFLVPFPMCGLMGLRVGMVDLVWTEESKGCCHFI